MPLHPADKKMIHSYLKSIEFLTLNLEDTAKNIKDRELSRHLGKIADDFTTLTTDMYDTLSRL